jgi:glucosamine-phosphate N-acetyltransferase
VAHIEDVVVSKEYQGKGIGEMLIQSLLDLAKDSDCYKTILDCSDEVKPFYEKIGFKITSNGMRYDHS